MYSTQKSSTTVSLFFRRSLLLLASLLFLFSSVPAIPATAASTTEADAYAQTVLDKKAAIEKTYDIKIVLPTVSKGSLGTATLATLDTCLSYLSADFVKQLSAWYKAETGQKLTFSYVGRAPTFANGSHPSAEFVYEKALINLFIPTSGQSFTLSGSSPVAILHELGHAYHAYAKQQYGASKLQSKWVSLNGEKIYGSSREPDRTKYVSAYALTDYDEDFAETFAHAFVCHNAGFSIASSLKKDGKVTVLGSKVAFLEELIAAHITKSDSALGTIKKAYTSPAQLSWEGLKLSGSSLEYIGFNAPHKVLPNVLRFAGIQSAESEWKKALGGWVVTAKDGGRYLVFPSGAKVTLKAKASS